jgi:hypothetical protein
MFLTPVLYIPKPAYQPVYEAQRSNKIFLYRTKQSKPILLSAIVLFTTRVSEPFNFLLYTTVDSKQGLPYIRIVLSEPRKTVEYIYF